MAGKAKGSPKVEGLGEVEVVGVVESKPPILVGEKTAQIVREASRMQQQAASILAAQEVTLREAHGLPDSWRLGLAPDGTVVLADTAPPVDASAGVTELGAAAAIQAAEAKRLNRNERRRAQRLAEQEAKAVAAAAALVAPKARAKKVVAA